ncbi:MAG: DUF2062 domain-containing protein [Proteobacteria bacterium]|nr:DUF2062 domain-containing protein [Pseudomonadota bacterium]MBU1058804.1 DUF2062 domain-containing protein [Pseudomonadota bacterium]
MNLTRIKKYYYLRFIRIKGDPESIAWGSFIGALIGTMPIMPFHTIGIIAICFLTRTSAMAGLFASLVISNPLTYIPIYYFCMVIGNFLTPYDITWNKTGAILNAIISGQGFKESIAILSNLGSEVIIVMLTGGIVLALPTAIICYFFTLRLFIKIRTKRMEKHILRQKKK